MIDCLLMGGPLDMHYDDKQRQWTPRRHSCVADFVKQHQISTYSIRYTHICLKDARDISEADLILLSAFIEKSTAERIIIVHGYQTMADTMDYIELKTLSLPCPIVLVWWKEPLLFSHPDTGKDLLLSLNANFTIGRSVSALIGDLPYSSSWVRDLRYRGELRSHYAF